MFVLLWDEKLDKEKWEEEKNPCLSGKIENERKEEEKKITRNKLRFKEYVCICASECVCMFYRIDGDKISNFTCIFVVCSSCYFFHSISDLIFHDFYLCASSTLLQMEWNGKGRQQLLQTSFDWAKNQTKKIKEKYAQTSACKKSFSHRLPFSSWEFFFFFSSFFVLRNLWETHFKVTFV